MNINDFDHTNDGYVYRDESGFTVSIDRDDWAENPFEAWDCEPPIVWTSGGALQGEPDVVRFFATVPDTWVSRHWRAICGVLDLDCDEHDERARDDKRDWPAMSLGEIRASMFRSALDDLKPGGHSRVSATDYLAALESLYALAGVPALHFSRNGCCRGDYVEGLAVLTPDWCKRVGYAPDKAHDSRNLEASADLLAAWAFGDVYSFTVTDPDGECIEACGGFYGAPWSDDGRHIVEEAGQVLAAAKRNHLAMGLRVMANEIATAARFAAGPYAPA